MSGVSSVVMVPTSVPPNKPFDGIFNGYVVLLKNPLSLICLVLGVIGIFAIYNHVDGPLEIIASALKRIVDDKTELPIIVSFCHMLLSIVKFLTSVKKKFFIGLIVSVIPLNVPSNSALVLSLILFLYCSVTSLDLIFLVIIVQIVYLLYFMDSFLTKLVSVVVLVYLIFGKTFVSSVFTIPH